VGAEFVAALAHRYGIQLVEDGKFKGWSAGARLPDTMSACCCR
jgi:hypothetical protein